MALSNIIMHMERQENTGRLEERIVRKIKAKLSNNY